MPMNPRVFREYDIRGVAESDFPDDFVADLGRATGAYFADAGVRRVTLGRDCRISSPRIHGTFKRELLAAGIDVVDVGVVHSPGLYFSVFHLGVEGGVMITASHNPSEDNGFKIVCGKSTIYGAEIQKLRAKIEQRAFRKDVAPGRATEHDILRDYVAYIADNMSNDDFMLEGETDAQDHRGAEDVNVVGDTFFQTMGIPIIGGRSFGKQDMASSQRVAIINQALAKKRFPNMNPIGKRFRADGPADAWIQIVGICADTRYANLRDDPPPQFFMPYVQQKDVGGMTYAIRTRLDPSQLVPALRQVVQKADRDLPIIDIRTQREQIDANMQMERAFAALTAGFGVLALALACVGIYGIMAYSVANRRNEIGIRLALGAQPGQVRGMILRESTWLAIAGIAVGVGAALGLTRLVKSMLYGIQAWDPLTIVGGVSILLAVALAASWIPARRAAGVQPMEALRHE